jgi:TfoX/Sxy family transcriptional regulator of competence genes
VFDELLAERIRIALAASAGITERKMFGGLVFMLNGNMCCGASRHGLMVRVGKEGRDEALTLPHTRPMLMKGREMAGFIFVDPEGCESRAALAKWVARGVRFASALPPKSS